jgi:thiamine pyrophosphate-dependent acetolactate synthase large subunit-like protein
VTGKIETFAPNAAVIHIDIDPAEIGKNKFVDVPIVGDVKAVLQTLLQRMQRRSRPPLRPTARSSSTSGSSGRRTSFLWSPRGLRSTR